MAGNETARGLSRVDFTDYYGASKRTSGKLDSCIAEICRYWESLRGGNTMGNFSVKFTSENIEISDLENLLLNMSAGLLPCHLTEDECDMLKAEFGKNWFYELGYTDGDYEKPRY